MFQTNIFAGEIRNLRLRGNRTNCPRCNGWAELPDGTFNVVGDTIEVLEATDLTRERLLRLQAILDRAREGRMDPEEAAAAVVKEAPELEPLIDRFRPKMGVALYAFLWFVFQILAAQVLAEVRDDSPSTSDVRQAVEEAVRQCQRP